MPHLRFREIPTSLIEKLSETLPAPLAKVMQTSEDNFTFELIPTQFFSSGKNSPGNPFVEVLWFKRTQDIQDRSATIITESLRKVYPTADITLVFIELHPHCYYENGQHFGGS
jgi:hypothetical protein